MSLLQTSTLLLLAGPAVATTVPVQDAFASPVRLAAGDRLLGAGRMYPSPVLHDVNGDGLPDIVVGDLIGKLTVALRLPGDGAPRYGPESSMKARDGEAIDFNNW